MLLGDRPDKGVGGFDGERVQAMRPIGLVLLRHRADPSQPRD